MLQLSTSQLLFYGGIAGIAVSVIAMAVSAAVFKATGRKIRKDLEKEYGKPRNRE